FAARIFALSHPTSWVELQAKRGEMCNTTVVTKSSATESIWCGAPPDTTGVNTCRWPLFPVDLPVHVVVPNGIDSLKTTGRGNRIGPCRHGPLRRSYSGTRSASRNRIPDTVPFASCRHFRNRTAIASGWLGFFSADCGEKSDDIAAAVDESVRR